MTDTKQDKRPKYPFHCPECGKQLWATKSIFMEAFGMNDWGGGTCPHCLIYLHLTFRPETQDFEAERYDTYAKRQRNSWNPPKNPDTESL